MNQQQHDRLRGQFPALAQEVNGHPLVYLDNAATTQKPQAVLDAINHYYRADNANVHRAAHALSGRATRAFEDARETVARFINAPLSHEVIWTRGTTEAINLVAQSWGMSELRAGDEIVLSTLEHHANIVPWQLVAQRTGAVIRVIPLDERGDLDIAAYLALLGPRTRLVSVAHVSNALGTVNPVKEMVASYTTSPMVQSDTQFRLYQLRTDASNMLVASNALTGGIRKSVSWWSPDVLRSFDGVLWEVEPVEVVARQRPAAKSWTLEAPEKAVFAEEQVNEAALRAWLTTNNLSLIVTRNQTSRDRGDLQQPFNLQVPGGVKTAKASGKVYQISHYQVLQGNQVRGYPGFEAGRRVLAQPITSSQHNVANPGGPAGSTKIAADGSTALFVPANRALAWQTTDANGEPVVRERVWVTMQPGEIRTCAGCHGENSANQAGSAEPANKPEALRALLRQWKSANGGNSTPILVNGSQPLTPTRGTSSATSQPVVAGAPAQATPGAALTSAVIEQSRPAVARRQAPALARRAAER